MPLPHDSCMGNFQAKYPTRDNPTFFLFSKRGLRRILYLSVSPFSLVPGSHFLVLSLRSSSVLFLHLIFWSQSLFQYYCFLLRFYPLVSFSYSVSSFFIGPEVTFLETSRVSTELTTTLLSGHLYSLYLMSSW